METLSEKSLERIVDVSGVSRYVIENGLFFNLVWDKGGAVMLTSGTLEMKNVEISMCHSNYCGGGLYASGMDEIIFESLCFVGCFAQKTVDNVGGNAFFISGNHFILLNFLIQKCGNDDDSDSSAWIQNGIVKMDMMNNTFSKSHFGSIGARFTTIALPSKITKCVVSYGRDWSLVEAIFNSVTIEEWIFHHNTMENNRLHSYYTTLKCLNSVFWSNTDLADFGHEGRIELQKCEFEKTTKWDLRPLMKLHFCLKTRRFIQKSSLRIHVLCAIIVPLFHY